MKGFYVKISLIPENWFYLGKKSFRQEPYAGILCQNFLNSRKRILPSIKYFSRRPYEVIFLFKISPNSRQLILLRFFFFSQEPFEGMLCQNFFNSQKRILPSIKYFSLRSYEGTECQNFFNSQKCILPSIKYFRLRSH